MSSRTNSNNFVTILIPDMMFTCNASIFGFAVSGKMLQRQPDSKIQIWRRKCTQPSIFYKIGRDISVNINSNGEFRTCSSIRSVVGNIRWCILVDDLRVSVQPGDILGLELPQTDMNNEILFTTGGHKNYIFQQKLESNKSDLLDTTAFTTVEQTPQIVLNLTSGRCSYINKMLLII